MPRENTSLQAFNRGKISPLGLARVDLTRTRLSAEVQRNYVPRVLGSMMFRPGWEFIGSTHNNNVAVHIPFVASIDADGMAILELTDMVMRVRIGDEVLTRASVSTAISNGTFDTDLANWTDADQAGSTSDWVTGGYMGLTGTNYNSAIRKQTLTIGASDQGVEHAIRVVVTRGVVTVKIGSTDGDDDYLATTSLLPGNHSLAFTPTAGSAYLEVSANTTYQTLLNSITIESAGAVTIPTIWEEDDLPLIRTSQSVDVVFCACEGKRQQRIERRSQSSWSVVDYVANLGPFRTENVSAITMAPAALTGDTTITASQKYFKSTNIGGLISITSVGQQVTGALNGSGQFTNEIKVIGTGTSRNFTIQRSGTWSGTLTVQRSIGVTGAWADTTTTYTTNATVVYNDGLDNQIIYYRVGFKTGDYTSGTATVTLTYDSGGLTGIGRITAYTSPTQVSVSVLQPFGGTGASEVWAEGSWSDRRGFPSSVALYEGRLWWAGKDRMYGSISDAFDNFEVSEDTEGDSGPINRSIGEGPVDTINWLLPLQRMIVGAEAAEFSARSSSFDELLTPDNFNLKTVGTHGSAKVEAKKVDNGGIFVEQGGTRVHELNYDIATYDYGTTHLTELVPDQCAAGVRRTALQRKPDTRLHCVLNDGTVALMVFDKSEEVISWIDIDTDGEIEDAFVLPVVESGEDAVYYVVKRTVGGMDVRYLEKWALEEECIGGLINKNADSFVVYDSTPTTTINDLDHLEGLEVVVWADGADVGTATVSSGSITLSTAASKVVVGLYYDAQYKSTKLAYAADGGTALNMKKRVTGVALILDHTHRYGIKYGGDFDHLDDLPGVEQGADVDDDHIWDQYDEDMIPLNGDWGTDSRLCLQSEAPKPCTVLCATISVETNG